MVASQEYFSLKIDKALAGTSLSSSSFTSVFQGVFCNISVTTLIIIIMNEKDQQSGVNCVCKVCECSFEAIVT